MDTVKSGRDTTKSFFVPVVLGDRCIVLFSFFLILILYNIYSVVIYLHSYIVLKKPMAQVSFIHVPLFKDLSFAVTITILDSPIL